MNYEHQRIASVLKRFGVAYDTFRVQVFTSGHINSTYKVDIRFRGQKDAFVLQRINTFVFRDPIGIMENIDAVTGHIRQKIRQAGQDPAGKVLEFMKRSDGTNYYFEDRENFWRCYRYVPNSITYDRADDPEMIRSVGRCFGTFQKQLCDFPMDRLTDTLPDFHNTPVRMANLFAAAESDPAGRRHLVKRELDLLQEHEAVWSRLEEDRRSGRLPLRVTHNDTKTNNVLVDQDSGEAVCVIDLDTVTPGLCAYDFGDAIRFCANRAAEDEEDLALVGLDLSLYEAFASGFVPVCRDFCSAEELESLALGAVTMTFELAARFLEDYLRGDRYFKTHRPDHNWYRGRSQLALALDMVRHLDEMQEINRRLAE